MQADTCHELYNQNDRKLPEQSFVRNYGHKLSKLIAAIEDIEHDVSVKLTYKKPSSEISGNIIRFLDEFADAGNGRYANYAALGDPNLGNKIEPIYKW